LGAVSEERLGPDRHLEHVPAGARPRNAEVDDLAVGVGQRDELARDGHAALEQAQARDVGAGRGG
jgi:hypothetical protein